MKKLTDAWYKAVNEYRYSKWNTCGPKEPIMPWIPPSVPVCLARVLRNVGTVVELEADESLYSAMEAKGGELHASLYDREDNLIYVSKGMIAREPSALRTGRTKISALSIAPAGRILGGGLDYYFCHPFASHSYSLTKAEIIVCSKKLLNQVLNVEQTLYQTMQQHFELCHLSNSITLEVVSGLALLERLKLYILSWGVYWGVLVQGMDGNMWIRIPLPLLRDDIARLVGTSKASVDKIFIGWKNDGLAYTETPYLYFRTDLVQHLLPWLCIFDEYRLTYRNNLNFEDFMPMVSGGIEG